MLTAETVSEDRERLENWIHQGRDLLGDVIPALLDAGERAHARAVEAERVGQALREENEQLANRVKQLEAELAHDRSERLEILDAVNRSMAEMTRPFNDILRKLGTS